MTEMLRMHPASASASVVRKVSKDVEILGHFVPKNMNRFLDIAATQRNPKLYHHPQTIIIIDRFLTREGQPKPPPLLTFGAPGSPHYCIGAALAKLMMKTTFATLLREYKYTLKAGQSRKYQILPDAAPESGVLVDSFRRREKT